MRVFQTLYVTNRVIGVYPEDAPEPCHLVELLVQDLAGPAAELGR